MFSKIPIDMQAVAGRNVDNEILRAAIMAELDAISAYEQMASLAEDRDVKRILLDVAQEEKTQVGEFQTMLLRRDKGQEQELRAGEAEVKEVLGNA